MKRSSSNPPAEPFFLKTELGDRFCLYHAPHPNKERCGAFIYVHPFCEEMNKSRRMVALQARAFAAMGFGVLQMDLFGCGDSGGEFGDARWEIWKQDLGVARSWLENRVTTPIGLWGLRLGALLALDFARSSVTMFDKIILWQPVINGELFLTQFLRLRLANEIFAGNLEKTTGTGIQAMRSFLATEGKLEVAGYNLNSDLATVIDGLRAIKLIVTKTPVHWFEVVSEPGRTMPPAGAKVAKAWEQKGSNLHVHLVPCVPFWATQEISECPELISATARILSKV
ncbi:MAG: hydrolase 2, exosortase A system-associated [Thermodesulfobacteriales bacterium]|jgi:exosortase A-associated hydrolase 2|nr:MAG: hydrolase 2, exosortase A system-associated [Thermodesulfobacteriales bacterium]